MTFEFTRQGSGRGATAKLVMTMLLGASATVGAQSQAQPSFAGTWSLVAADHENPDGTRSRDYGDHPKGRMMIDEKGRYSIQIFQLERPNYADPQHRTAEEYRSAIQGASTNYGEIRVDWANHILRTTFDEALNPNLRGTVQMRPFRFDGEVLSYRILPSREGEIVRISEWRPEM